MNKKKKTDFYSRINSLEIIDDPNNGPFDAAPIAGKDGSVTFGAELQLKNYHSFFLESDNTCKLSKIATAWSMAMQKMGTGVVWHRQDIFYPSTDTPDIKAKDFLTSAHKRYYLGRPYMKHRSFLFVTCKNTGLGGYVDKEELNDFRDKLYTFFNSVDGSCIEGYQWMKAQDYYNYLVSMVALDFSTDANKKKILLDMDFENGKIGDYYLDTYLINDNSMAANDAEYSLNNKWSQLENEVYCVNSLTYPLAFGVSALHILNNVISIPDRAYIEKKVVDAKKGAAFLKQTQLAEENDAYQAGLDDNLNLGVQHHFSAHCFSVNLEHKDRNRKDFEVAIGNVFGDFVKATYNLGNVWINTLGGGASRLSNDDMYFSYLQEAVKYNNWEGVGSQDTKGMIMEDLNGVPFVVDLTYKPKEEERISNYNGFIVGPSGSGKSFMVSDKIISEYAQGDRIIIIDMMRSYDRVCKMLKGRFISYERMEDLSFNPFCVKENMDYEDWRDFKQFIVNLLFACWKKKDVNPAELTTFRNAVNDFYTLHTKENDLDSVNFSALYDFFDSHRKEYSDYADIGNFLFVTAKYNKGGSHELLLNGKKNLDISDDTFVVFEMEKVLSDDETKDVVIAVVLNFISRMVLTNKQTGGSKFRLYIDEAWNFMKVPKVRDFIGYAYRVFRKFDSAACLIVQNISDLFMTQKSEGDDKPKDDVAEEIVNNSGTKILLQHDVGYIRKHGADIGLNTKEIEMICMMKKPAVFIKQGPVAKVWRPFVPPEWFVLFNTEKSIRDRWNIVLNENKGRMQPAVEQMTAELFDDKNNQ